MNLDQLNTPLVSIACISYNHAKYIREAIESFLMQKTNFTYEIIIHDDASTDGTSQIIKEFELKHPNLIFPTCQTENQFSKGVRRILATFVFPKCRGKYIALCEGDDYWIDSCKLQKQVDFLEANPDYGLVHHEANYLFQKSGEIIKNHHKTNNHIISDGFVFQELLKENNIYTPTVMFKTSLLNYFKAIDENVWNKFIIGDYGMWLEFSQHCKFHYIPQSMATYRVLENSASKSPSYEKAMLFLNSYFNIKLFFIRRYPLNSITIDSIEQWRVSDSLSYAIKYKRDKEAREIASKIKITNWRTLLKRLLVFTPEIFRYIQKNKL